MAIGTIRCNRVMQRLTPCALWGSASDRLSKSFHLISPDLVDGLSRFLCRNRVTSFFVANALTLGYQRYCEVVWRPWLARFPERPRSYRDFDRMHQKYSEDVLRFAHNVCREAPQAVLLKGPALKAYVPEYPRYFNDIDLYIDDLGGGVVIENYLSSNGFRLLGRRVPVRDEGIDGFKATYKKGGYVVEIHCGFYPIGLLRYPKRLRLDLTGNSRMLDLYGLPFRVPSPEDVYLVMLGHIVQHGAVSLKDVCDLWLIRQVFDLNAGYLSDRIGANHLNTVSKAIDRIADGLYSADTRSFFGRLLDSELMRFAMRGKEKCLTGSLMVRGVWNIVRCSANGSVCKGLGEMCSSYRLEIQNRLLSLWRST